MKERILKIGKFTNKWRRRYKTFKILQKIFGILIVTANFGISLWQFYEKFLKERIGALNSDEKAA